MNLFAIPPVFIMIAGVSELFHDKGFFWWPIWVLMVLVINVTLVRGFIMAGWRKDLWQKRMTGAAPNIHAVGLYACFAFLLGAQHESMPWWIHVAGFFQWCMGHALSQWALMHNDWAITETKLQAGQKVCRSGPYKYFAHPMYKGTWLICTGAAMLDGSFLGVVYAFFIIGAALAYRAIGEQHLLRASLPGYREYLEGK